MTTIDRSSSGMDSRRSSGRNTPTTLSQMKPSPTAFNSMPSKGTGIEIKNPLLGAAVSPQIKHNDKVKIRAGLPNC